MPHKKNPDVFELIRARCNKLQTLPIEIGSILGNLPSGYFRDMQVIKESFLPAFAEIQTILHIATFAIGEIGVNTHILDDPKYNYMFSVEEVNRLVLLGVPFRDAYKIVGKQIEDGNFNPDRNIKHTHEGSLGNLCNDKIAEKFVRIFSELDKSKVDKIKASLLVYRK